MPVPADDSAISDVESRELPLDLAPGTARKLCVFPHCDVGDETLCGDVGLLSLLSNEFAARNSVGGVERCCGGCDSCDDCDEGSVTFPLCNNDRLSGRLPKGTALPISGLLLLTAEVSIVIVGALCLRTGPGEGVWRPAAPISSAISGTRTSNTNARRNAPAQHDLELDA